MPKTETTNCQDATVLVSPQDSPYKKNVDVGKKAPRIELSRSDLIRLLSYLEGELQARDVVIATLKAEKAKQLLYQAKYGRLGLNDPLAALQRDSEATDSHDDFDEASVGQMYDSQLAQLEKLIASQKAAHHRMRHMLAAAEKRHAKVVKELEEERQKHAVDTAQGDDVCMLLEKERERLRQELDFEKQQGQKVDKELKKLQTMLADEKDRHKQMVLYLMGERKQLLLRLAEERQKIAQMTETLQQMVVTSADAKQQRHEGAETKTELDKLRSEVVRLRQENADLREICKTQEEDLNLIRENILAKSKQQQNLLLSPTNTKGTIKFVKSNSLSAASPPGLAAASQSTARPASSSRPSLAPALKLVNVTDPTYVHPPAPPSNAPGGLQRSATTGIPRVNASQANTGNVHLLNNRAAEAPSMLHQYAESVTTNVSVTSTSGIRHHSNPPPMYQPVRAATAVPFPTTSYATPRKPTGKAVPTPALPAARGTYFPGPHVSHYADATDLAPGARPIDFSAQSRAVYSAAPGALHDQPMSRQSQKGQQQVSNVDDGKNQGSSGGGGIVSPFSEVIEPEIARLEAIVSSMTPAADSFGLTVTPHSQHHDNALHYPVGSDLLVNKPHAPSTMANPYNPPLSMPFHVQNGGTGRSGVDLPVPRLSRQLSAEADGLKIGVIRRRAPTPAPPFAPRAGDQRPSTHLTMVSNSREMGVPPVGVPPTIGPAGLQVGAMKRLGRKQPAQTGSRVADVRATEV